MKVEYTQAVRSITQTFPHIILISIGKHMDESLILGKNCMASGKLHEAKSIAI